MGVGQVGVALGESSAQTLQRQPYKYSAVCAFDQKSSDGFIKQRGTSSHNKEN